MGRIVRIAGLLAVLLAGLLGGNAAPVRGTGFVVNSDFDDNEAHDASPGDCICADTYGWCTLRAAVEEANACPGADTITFAQAMTIFVNGASGSFRLYETATLDASSVWDTASNVPGVVINGKGGGFAGLYLGASSCQIYGLTITAFGGDGILVVSAANQIGGSGAGQRNVLSGNDTGIGLASSGAQNNTLYNNYLGLTPEGDAAYPNETGLSISNGAVDNIIGGSGAGQANFFAGNSYDGITVDGSGTDNNWIVGNVIGLAVNLTTNLGNGAWGIRVRNGAANTFIGGASGEGNLIAYSAYSGISVENSSGTQIANNIIGGNGSDGIALTNSTASVVSNNFISGNTLHGVRVVGASAAGNLIWPNSIYGNDSKGIHLQDGGNMGIAAPAISSAGPWGASGTTCPSCRVALYSDSADEGQVYHDIVSADAAGDWIYFGGPLTGPNLTATSIDTSGNTSEFSAPYSLVKHRVFLPSILRKP